VRKIVFEKAGLGGDEYIDELSSTVGDALLTPTRIYVQPIRKILAHYKVKGVVHGIAHITGGGLLENLSRILPEGVTAVIERDSWPVPPVFPWLQKMGDVEADEMARVFNMGLGLVLVVSAFYADSIAQQLADQGLACFTIGRISAGERGAVWA
jgi:phosphoribosylformylglycinamidine cyclo-ligase